MSQVVSQPRTASRAADVSLIQSLTPRGSEPVSVGPITVLIGGNNTGKTETLRDILRLSTNWSTAETPSQTSGDEGPRARVLNDLSFVPKLSVERFMHGLMVVEEQGTEGAAVQGLAPDLRTPLRRAIGADLKNILYRPVVTARSTWASKLGQLMALRMFHVTPVDCRRLISPSNACGPLDAPESLLQLLHAATPSTHEALDDALAAAFDGMHVMLDQSERVRLTLRVGSTTFPAEVADPIANVRQYQRLPELHEQGDACQSYAAIVLSMLVGAGRVILLDQPETYLHPAQARTLGRWIATQAPRLSCQVFLATHSHALLQGLAEGTSEVTLLRTSRRGDTTRFQSIPSDTTKALARLPLFTCQEALRLFFREGVVVVLDDRDQIVYETAAAHCLGSDRLGFVQACGARNLSYVTKSFRQTGNPVAVITELGILRSEKEFGELVLAATGSSPPAAWLATRERLARHVEGAFDDETLAQDAHEVERFIKRLNGDGVQDDEPRDATEAARDSRSWDRLRSEQLESLPRELRVWVEELIEDLKRKGIFISPKGRLEGWLDLDSHSGTVWLNQAMQALYHGKCPAELNAFVGEVVSYLRSSTTPARLTRAGHDTGSTTPG